MQENIKIYKSRRLCRSSKIDNQIPGETNIGMGYKRNGGARHEQACESLRQEMAYHISLEEDAAMKSIENLLKKQDFTIEFIQTKLRIEENLSGTNQYEIRRSSFSPLNKPNEGHFFSLVETCKNLHTFASHMLLLP